MTMLIPKSIFTYALFTLKSRWVKEVQTFYKPITIPDDLHKFAQEFAQSLPLDVMMAFNGRFERGENMAREGMVSTYENPVCPDRKHLFRVRSSNASGPPFSYVMDLENQTCECPDHLKGHFCLRFYQYMKCAGWGRQFHSLVTKITEAYRCKTKLV